jgi:N-acetylated-alpha-linked acidic dipeptidase
MPADDRSDRAGAAARTALSPGLVRALGLWDSTLLVVGLVLGSAVFMVTGGPGGVASLLPAPGWILAAWIVGGIISFAGALVYAELGAALPHAGGQYVFLREAYGDLIGFLYGWTLFAVIHTGTLAALAVGYAEYFGYFVPALGNGRVVASLPFPGAPLPVSAGQLNAVAVLVFLSIVNYFGIREGSLFQGIVTVVKIASFAGFIVLGVLIGRGDLAHFVPLFSAAAGPGAAAGAAPGAVTLGGFVLAMVAMLWAYEGWNNITFTAGEIRDPHRNLPRSLVFGMGMITLIYVGMNLVYLYAMPAGEMIGTARIGEAAAGRLFGPAGARLMSLAVLISVFGCISATVISGPRVFYAMARDGLFFRSIAEVHPRRRTPARAILWQCVWSCVLCLSGRYDQLYTFAMFAAVLFYALAGASVMVLRARHPEWARPYRTWGYPLTPIVYVAVCAVVLANTLVRQPLESAWGLAILAAGLPAFLFWRGRAARRASGAGAAAVLGLVLAGLAAGTAVLAADPPPAPAASPPSSPAPAAAPPPSAPGAAPIFGFYPEAEKAERRLEESLLVLPDPKRLEAHSRALTAEPHLAGTPGGERVARYIADRMREAGLDVEMKRYRSYMGYVRSAALEQVQPEKRTLATPEDPVDGDPATARPEVRLDWNAFSPSADLTREVVYANYALPEDFEALARLGVEVKDRILLVRYFHGYRGGKLLEAERRGAAGVVFYSDPAEDGFVHGDVYPDGPWGPPSHVQRGAALFDFDQPGDPLSPGWAATARARRLRPEESRVLPHTPCLPISGRDALVILQALKGPVVPAGWQGALPVTYHVGPGPSRVHLKIEASFEDRDIVDVIGVLRGTEEPDKMVILSNHHDAWVYGAADPVSGTATILETARVAGDLARRGLLPRRTLVFGVWDAEEWTLGGSTEWGEDREKDLAAGGVACLNVDIAASGPAFQATAVPTLRRFISDALRTVRDPRSGRDLHSVTAERVHASESFHKLYGPLTGQQNERPEEIPYDILGSGSDYTVFFNHLGMPALDAGFEGPYGVYHSAYDDFAWMSRFGDPGFSYHAAMTRLLGVMAYRMANADLLPFQESPYPADARIYLADLEEQTARRAALPDLAALRAALADWEGAAARFDSQAEAALRGPRPAPSALAAANAALMKTERALLAPGGLPGRSWYRHLIYAPYPSYAAETLPGLREAVAAADAVRARDQAALLAAAFRSRAALLREATQALAPRGPAQR